MNINKIRELVREYLVYVIIGAVFLVLVIGLIVFLATHKGGGKDDDCKPFGRKNPSRPPAADRFGRRPAQSGGDMLFPDISEGLGDQGAVHSENPSFAR